MRLSERLEAIHRDFPLDWTMRVLESLCEFDRYQASEGIERAAGSVAVAAEQAGLQDVSITPYDVTHGLKWWSFDSPRPWTPVSAMLQLRETVVSFPCDRMSLATYSAPCPSPTEFRLHWLDAECLTQESASWKAIRDSVVVLSPSVRNVREAMEWVEQAGGAGVIADPLRSRREQRGVGQQARGRIELQPGTRLFAFSVVPEELAMFERAASQGQFARVCIKIRQSGRMPLVQGVLPATHGKSGAAREILIQAHLCHPGPGANDNASGVAASLGVARMLAARGAPRDRAIRFVFGPEFVGTAAYLHDFPRNIEAAINLDMLGEDPGLTGSVLILERPPDHVASALGALAERCLELLPTTRKSYSEAVPVPEGQWCSTPFVGASDHGLFADRKFAVPAVQLSHYPDRFNHTSSDSLDKVAPSELKRSATVAATCAEVLSGLKRDDQEALARLTAFAVAREVASLCQRDPEPATPAIINPYAADQLSLLVDYVLQVGKRQLASTRAASSHQLAAWLDAWVRECPRGPGGVNTQVRGRNERAGDVGSSSHNTRAKRLRAEWVGPFNLKGLAGALPDGRSIGRGHFPRLLSLALAIDGESTRDEVVQRAAFSSRLPIALDEAHEFFDALVRAGWARE